MKYHLSNKETFHRLGRRIRVNMTEAPTDPYANVNDNDTLVFALSAIVGMNYHKTAEILDALSEFLETRLEINSVEGIIVLCKKKSKQWTHEQLMAAKTKRAATVKARQIDEVTKPQGKYHTCQVLNCLDPAYYGRRCKLHGELHQKSIESIRQQEKLKRSGK